MQQEGGCCGSSFLSFLNDLEQEGILSCHHGDVPPRLKGACCLSLCCIPLLATVFVRGRYIRMSDVWMYTSTMCGLAALVSITFGIRVWAGVCGWTVLDDKMDEWKRRRQTWFMQGKEGKPYKANSLYQFLRRLGFFPTEVSRCTQSFLYAGFVFAAVPNHFSRCYGAVRECVALRRPVAVAAGDEASESRARLRRQSQLQVGWIAPPQVHSEQEGKTAAVSDSGRP